MKIAIVGSRDWKYLDFSCDIICEILNRHINEEDFYVISGGARGIDTQAETIAKKKGIQIIIFKPGNELIINEADIVIAFWEGKSKGTKHLIDLAIKAGKPLNIYVRP